MYDYSNSMRVNKPKMGFFCLQKRQKSPQKVKKMSIDTQIFAEKIKETNGVDLELKLKVYSLLKDIRKESEKKSLGMIIVLGYSDRWKDYVYKMDYDKFDKEKCNLSDECAKRRVYETGPYDGAILVSPEGDILHSGIGLDVRVKKVLEELKAGEKKSINEVIGYKDNVGSRHSSSFVASYMMHDSLVYVLSEETKRISVFYQGKLVFVDEYSYGTGKHEDLQAVK
jgi:DNA integrity scanning protein DisA with diadenylate cyclase activity